MTEEPLLELIRDLTDKEKIAWLARTHGKLQGRYKELERQNKNLKAKNEKLTQKIKEDDLQYPSELNGSKFVSVRAYFRLRERYAELDKRFWETIAELNNYKKEEKI